ncbi:MAG TPA: serine/threonine-protein kinase, partial [Kofleriaceae bacterium]|nr:serine/threonine-protein kinase [Kofleriaceae bacterium]
MQEVTPRKKSGPRGSDADPTEQVEAVLPPDEVTNADLHIETPTGVQSGGDGFALEPGTMLGDYRIEGKLGEGGMGVVFSAIHPLIGKRAAIKVLKKELCADPIALERFINEARAVNEIGHPNIVDIFTFGETLGGRSYLVMEWLKGTTLRDRIARERLRLPDVCAIVRPLARALAAAHDKGIIHRDLKPENVFLVDVKGEATIVKLLDFGIAKLGRAGRSLERTATGEMVGTPMYIAPEQARGREIDARADIYSLGGIVFELLTGRPPFVADNAMDMVAQHLIEPPPSPRELAPDVPIELDRVVHAMLAKDA